MSDTDVIDETSRPRDAVGAHARSRRPARWIALTIATVVVGFLVVLATRPSAQSVAASSPLLGQPAPEVTARTIDGTTARLATYRGRWVLVNFFATWCVPCRQEHPDLVAFEERHRASGDAAVVGVVYDDTPSAVARFRQELGGDWPMLIDDRGRIALEFGVRGIPESFLISPTGVVMSRIVGGVEDDDLEGLLRRAKSAS